MSWHSFPDALDDHPRILVDSLLRGNREAIRAEVRGRVGIFRKNTQGGPTHPREAPWRRYRANTASSAHPPPPLTTRARASPSASTRYSNPSPCWVPYQFMKKPCCLWTT